MRILTKQELEALKNFLITPYNGFSKPEWEAARDAWLATPFMMAAEKAVKTVDESAYSWISTKELPVDDGLLRLEVRFESTIKGSTGPDGCEVDLVETYAAKKAAVKASKLSEAFEKALEDAGFDVQWTGDPLDGVRYYYVSGTTDDDGNVVYGDWVAWTDEEPVLVFYVDCLGGSAEGES